VIPSFPLNGLGVRSVVYTAASNAAGSFRKINAGVRAITEVSEEREFKCFTAEPHIHEDCAIADRYENGPIAWMEAKSARILKLEMLAWVKQLYYGPGNNGDGFPGLIQTYDRTRMEINVGGTTNNTASSVWLIRAAAPGSLADDGARWRYGNNGAMSFKPVQTLPMPDPADKTGQKMLFKYVTGFTGYPGFQVQSLMTVVRIKGLTMEDGKGLWICYLRLLEIGCSLIARQIPRTSLML